MHQGRPARCQAQCDGVLGRGRLPRHGGTGTGAGLVREGADREGEGRRAPGGRSGQGDMTAPPVGAEHAVPAQHVQCLPHGLPAHAEVLGQPALARQPFPRRDAPVVQLAEQLVGDLPVQGPGVGERVVVRGGAGHAAPSSR
ncbi:hypothetical protein TPA0905_67690 [Streptomyces olivaceus]|nr:hypothetical protein TPA0905_67690 [Streptomyces olivaceus]